MALRISDTIIAGTWPSKSSNSIFWLIYHYRPFSQGFFKYFTSNKILYKNARSPAQLFWNLLNDQLNIFLRLPSIPLVSWNYITFSASIYSFKSMNYPLHIVITFLAKISIASAKRLIWKSFLSNRTVPYMPEQSACTLRFAAHLQLGIHPQDSPSPAFTPS